MESADVGTGAVPEGEVSEGEVPESEVAEGGVTEGEVSGWHRVSKLTTGFSDATVQAPS